MNKALILLSMSLTLGVMAQAQCPVDTVLIRRRVKNASPDSIVRVQFVFPKEKPGESGEVTVEDGTFQIPLEFVTTQSSIFSNLPKRCGRKPKSVEITLVENHQEVDRLSLDFSKAFKMEDASAYALRSELVLSGSH